MKAFEIFSVVFNDETEEKQNILYDALQGMTEVELQSKYGISPDEAKDVRVALENIELFTKMAKVAPENKVRFRANMNDYYNSYMAYVSEYCARSLNSGVRHIDYDQIDVQWDTNNEKFIISVVVKKYKGSGSSRRSYTKLYRDIPPDIRYALALERKLGVSSKDVARKYSVSTTSVNLYYKMYGEYSTKYLKQEIIDAKRAKERHGALYLANKPTKVLNPVVDMSLYRECIAEYQQSFNISMLMVGQNRNDLVTVSESDELPHNQRIDIYNDSHKVIMKSNIKCGLFVDENYGIPLEMSVFTNNPADTLEPDEQRKVVLEFLKEHVLDSGGESKCDMVLYYSELCDELETVIKACKKHGIDLIIARRDADDDTYTYQSMWGVVDDCDTQHELSPIVQYANKSCDALYTYKCELEDLDQDFVYIVTFVVYDYYPDLNDANNHKQSIINSKIRYISSNYDDCKELVNTLVSEYTICEPKRPNPIIIKCTKIETAEEEKSGFTKTVLGSSNNIQ